MLKLFTLCIKSTKKTNKLLYCELSARDKAQCYQLGFKNLAREAKTSFNNFAYFRK